LQLNYIYFVLKFENKSELTTNYSDIHKDIIEKSKKGDLKAQFKLYNLYSKAMFNICFRMMNNREEAEDMLQEAFSEAFDKLNYFRFESAFGAWLKRIVVNKCINQIKKKKIDLVLSDEVLKYEKSDEKDITEPAYDIKKINNAIEKLSDGFRVVFILYLMEGYDHQEISEILGISESTSKSQYLRAKRKLREILLNS
jgi:RNA polymerase sigma factor (sigma-70 family)